MAFSLMNGLSALGAGVSQFAGTAGLEYQKSALANQSAILADSLATARETTLQRSRGVIEAAAAEKAQAATAANTQALIAGRSTDTAAEIAGRTANTQATIAGTASNTAAEIAGRADAARIVAASPAEQEKILSARTETAVNNVKLKNATDLQTAHEALQAETAKPDADPTKVATLKSAVTTLETSATTEAATTTAAAAMYRTDMDAVQHYNTQLVTATAALNAPDMSDTDRTAQKGLIANLKTQLNGAQTALKYSSDLVHGRVGTATGNEPPGVAPTPPAGVPPGARYSPSMKIWQAPDGRLFDARGQPTTKPAPAGFINNDQGEVVVN
jgi:hypothetical protein